MTSKPFPVRQVWAVLRIDDSPTASQKAEDLADRVMVKQVVLDEDLARGEVDRLNALNAAKGSYYFAQVTRLVDRDSNVLP